MHLGCLRPVRHSLLLRYNFEEQVGDDARDDLGAPKKQGGL